MLKFLSYGESLVDFLPSERGPLRDVDTFTKTVGGAPTNAAVALGRLGCDVALMGIVGDDEFGHFVTQKLEREGVDATFVEKTKRAKTGITFVTLDHNGDRSFLFFREPSADLTITPEEISEDALDNRDVMLMGSNLLTEEPARSATLHAMTLAEEKGVPIVMDVNYRPHLWSDPETAKTVIDAAYPRCTVIKMNEDELRFATGADQPSDPKVATFYRTLQESGLHTLLVTLAERGAVALTPAGQFSAEAPLVDVVDTTGAGDGFIAGFLTFVSSASAGDFRKTLDSLDAEQWARALTAACFVGSRVCTELGATPALPKKEELPPHLFHS